MFFLYIQKYDLVNITVFHMNTRTLAMLDSSRLFILLCSSKNKTSNRRQNEHKIIPNKGCAFPTPSNSFHQLLPLDFSDSIRALHFIVRSGLFCYATATVFPRLPVYWFEFSHFDVIV